MCLMHKKHLIMSHPCFQRLTPQEACYPSWLMKQVRQRDKIKFKSHLQLGKLWCISMNPRIEIVSETFGSNDHKEYMDCSILNWQTSDGRAVWGVPVVEEVDWEKSTWVSPSSTRCWCRTQGNLPGGRLELKPFGQQWPVGFQSAE